VGNTARAAKGVTFMSIGTALRVVFTLFLTVSSASAQSNKDQALDSLQKEASTCIAYYTIVQECGHDADASKAMYEQSKLRHKKAIDVSRMVGLGIKMSEEVMTARWKASMEEQMALMNGNCTNISSLESRHAARCKKLIENPASVLGEYTKK
jgi:hypothetical protein